MVSTAGRTSSSSSQVHQAATGSRLVPLSLPEKSGWERVEGRLSGGYYRRPGSGRPIVAVA